MCVIWKKFIIKMSNNRDRLVQHLSSVENCHRINSLAIDLSTIYGRDMIPNRLEMFKFVNKQLSLKAEELVDVQNHPFLPQVFVKVKTEAILVRVEQKLMAGVKVYQKDIVLFGWRCDIPLTTVKINGANPDTTKQKVMEVMSKYGKVSSCDRGRIDYFRESFVSDGTWLVRIRPDQGKGLPSIIYFTENGNTDVWSIIFDGKVSICWKCGQENHRGDMCRSVRPKTSEQGQTAPLGIGSYCDVVKNGVAEEWLGMSATGVNLGKQKSLVKPLPVVPSRKENQQVKKGKMLAPPAVLSNKWKNKSTDMVAKANYSSMVAHRTGDVCLAVNTNNRYSVLAHAGLGDMASGGSGESGDEDDMEEIDVETIGLNGGKNVKKRRNSDVGGERGVKPRQEGEGNIPVVATVSDSGSDEELGDRGQDLHTQAGGDGVWGEENMESQVSQDSLRLLAESQGGTQDEMGLTQEPEQGGQDLGVDGLSEGGGQLGGEGHEGGHGNKGGGGRIRFMGGHPLSMGASDKGGKQLGKSPGFDSQLMTSSPHPQSVEQTKSSDLITQN